MDLKELSIKDKKYVDKFLRQEQHELSTYAFENIYIWKGLFKIYWTEIKNSLCIFFEDRNGCFLYLPPLGRHIVSEVIDEAFEIMDKRNGDQVISRIENIQEKDLKPYQDLGYECIYKCCDYVCRRDSLVQLKGDKFKSKRNSFNYFIKHYQFEYLNFSLKYKKDCINLYNLWMEKRKNKFTEKIYQNMLKDNELSLETLLNAYEYLDCIGRIVRVDKEVKAFTFGFELNDEMFCILYEITDLSIKGIAQFISRKFCTELSYRYINIMDDSGLENLKKEKLSYHPKRLIPAYIVRKKNR